MANAIVRSVITLYKELRVPGCLTDVGAEGAEIPIGRVFRCSFGMYTRRIG